MTTAQAEDARRALNRLIDQWKAERLQIYQIGITTVVVTPGITDYILGLGQVAGPGVVNIDRPVFISHVGLQDNSVTPPSEMLLDALTDDGWAGITPKLMAAYQPSAYYYKPYYPNGYLRVWPTPTGSNLRLVLYVPQAVQEFLTINDTVALPPGYARMIVKNLALELAPSYGVQVDNNLARQAIEAKAVVKCANTRLADLSFPADSLIGGGGGWDIRMGP